MLTSPCGYPKDPTSESQEERTKTWKFPDGIQLMQRLLLSFENIKN